MVRVPSKLPVRMVVAGQMIATGCIRALGSPSSWVEVREMSIHIEPDEGADAAAQIPDDQFQLLVKIVVWELALRTSAEQFEAHVRQLVEFREKIEPDLEGARKERDDRRFIAAVLADLEALPSTEDHPERASSEPTTGLYL
jgi:hypothetical protein